MLKSNQSVHIDNEKSCKKYQFNMLSIKVEARMRNILWLDLHSGNKICYFFPVIYKDDSSDIKTHHKHNVIIFEFKKLYCKDWRNEPKGNYIIVYLKSTSWI